MNKINWKRQFVSFTNLIYWYAAFEHLMVSNYIMATCLFILGYTSFVYHFKLANGKKNIFWQRMDVSSIYLVLGFYPFTISGEPITLLWLLPAVYAIGNKFALEIFSPHKRLSSTTVTILLSVPTLVLAMVYLPKPIVISSMVIIIWAQFISIIADKFPKLSEAYNKAHGVWHIASGFVFSLLK